MSLVAIADIRCRSSSIIFSAFPAIFHLHGSVTTRRPSYRKPPSPVEPASRNIKRPCAFRPLPALPPLRAACHGFAHGDI